MAQDDEQFTKEIALESRDQLLNIYSSSKLNDNHSKKNRTKDKPTRFMDNNLLPEAIIEETDQKNNVMVIEKKE